MFVYPHPDPIALSLGPLHVRWYGLMYLVGFLSAWWLARHRAGRPESTWKPVEVDDLIFFSAVGVILGGRLGWMLFYGTERILSEPLSVFRIWEGGMSFHGGLIGVLVALALFARSRKKQLVDVFDFAAPLTGIGFGAGRIGNFINGELWGKLTQSNWGVIFPDSLPATYSNLTAVQLQSLQSTGTLDAFARHPTQLYQMLLEGVFLFVFLFWLTRKPRARYLASGWFALLYGVFRFVVEFLRVPDEQLGYLAGDWLTMGQVLSLPLIALGLVFLYMARTSPVMQPMPAKAAEAR